MGGFSQDEDFPASACCCSLCPRSLSFNCPMYDIDLHGNDLDVFQDIGSWQECAHICNIYPTNCKFWSWNGGNGNHYCYMKSSNAGMQSWDGSVSGERGCEGF